MFSIVQRMIPPDQGGPATTPTPAPPPEAALIRRARLAAGLKVRPLARKVGPNGISTGRWSQIETGWETRRGELRPARAEDGTLAWMAYLLHVTPERLASEGQRPEAAEVLREIQRNRARTLGLDPDTLPAALLRVAADPEYSDEEALAMIAAAKLIRSRHQGTVQPSPAAPVERRHA